MKYILEKYKGQGTRFTCPKCGRKHSFTRYIDKEAGKRVIIVGVGSKPALKRTPNNKNNQFSRAGLEPAPTDIRHLFIIIY